MRYTENLQVPAGTRAHLQALGFETLAAYQAWCVAEGLRPNLRKGAQEKARECELRRCERWRVQPAPRGVSRAINQMEHLLTLLAYNRRPKCIAQYPELWGLKPLFVKARRDTTTCAAFTELLRLVYRNVFLATGRFNGFGSSLPEALLALAQQSSWWLCSPETWKPRRLDESSLLHSLTRHLLARYPVPAYFDSAWRVPNKDEQRWFRLVGQGRNLREATLPLVFTARMAHLAMTEVPESVTTITQGLRWAQVRGLGGSPRLAQAVIGTFLGESFEDEAFWSTAVQFLVNSPELPLEQVGPLIDYLRFERTEPRGDDELSRLPEGFTLKGRTVGALVRRMEEWHVQLRWRSRFSARSWAGLGISGLEWQEWEIAEITEARLLVAEGEAMHHCVASYGQRCIDGDASIWSLRRKTPEGSKRIMTIRLSRDKVIQEARGKFNASPTLAYRTQLDEAEQELLQEGAKVVKRWAKLRHVEIAAHVL